MSRTVPGAELGSFIQLFNRYLLNLEFLPGTVLRAGDTVGHTKDKIPVFVDYVGGDWAINNCIYETDKNMQTYELEGLSGYGL